MNILIVDDVPAELAALRAVLEAEGFKVIAAADGMEAWAVLERMQIDAIISDILMPRMDGYSLCQEVRANPRLFATPFICYTSTYTATTDAALAHEVGADRILKKPAPPGVVLETLRDVMKSASHPHPVPIAAPPARKATKEYNERLVEMLVEKNAELEHRMAELRSAQGQLRQLLAHSPAVIYTLRLNGRELIPETRSENITAWLGFTVEESLRHEWFEEHVHPQDRSRVSAGLLNTLAQGSNKMEYRFRHKDGTYRWVEDSIRVFPNAADQPASLVGVWADITERKRAEEVVRQVSESGKARPKFNVMKDLIALAGLGIFVFCVAFAFDMFKGPIELMTKYKDSAVDDFWGTLIVFSPLFTLFAYRRWKDSALAMNERQQAATEMRLVALDTIRQRQRGAGKELAVLALLFVLVTAITARFNFFERPFAWIWENRNTPVDELIGTLLVVGLVMIPASFTFAYRRWHQTEVEIDDHRRSMSALRSLHDELDKQVQQRTVELATANDTLRAEITERKRTEEALAAEKILLRTLIDQIPDEIYVKDRASCFLLANVATARAFGVGSPEQVVGKSDIDFWGPEQAAHYRTAELAVIAGRPLIDQEDTIKLADGRWRVKVTSKLPLYDRDRSVIGLVGVGRDITERRRLEQQFRQAQKMEAIGTLAGGIAHDFNNILGAIYGYTELARMETTAQPEIREHLDAVLQGAARATALVRQILAFSRHQEQERKPIQLRQVVGEALKLLRATIPAIIDFEVSLPSDTPNVLADATQIHQVVMNLGTNAAHAMKEQPGRLTVKLENVNLDADFATLHPGLQSGRYLRLSVSDTGHGMDEGTLARIFEPFYTTKAPGEGTGLGLAVVHGIMQSHEGAVTVYSHPGEGTTFHLHFPVHAGEEMIEAATPAAVPRGQGERILYVDDELPLAHLGQKILERLGYAVDMRTKPAEALVAVRAQPEAYDLVVTDQMMPGLTGTDLAQQLHAIRPELPIILTTGYAAGLTAERIEAMGIRKLLSKPVSIESLGALVHQVLSDVKSR